MIGALIRDMPVAVASMQGSTCIDLPLLIQLCVRHLSGDTYLRYRYKFEYSDRLKNDKAMLEWKLEWNIADVVKHLGKLSIECG
jgi:hypothetical protein